MSLTATLKKRIEALSFDPRGLVLPALFLILWQTATSLHWVDVRIIPFPSEVLDVAWKWINNGSLARGLTASLGRDLAGFTFGATAGVALGAFLGVSRWAELLVAPTFHTVKHIALFAWIPLLSAFFGRDDLAKVIFIALATLFPVALGTLEGVKGILKSQIEVAQVYGFTPRQTLFRLVLPAASPQIIAGLHLGLIYAWLATIGAEFLLLTATDGIGFTVIRGRASFHVELVLFGMLVIGLTGAALNAIASRVESRLLHWRGGH